VHSLSRPLPSFGLAGRSIGTRPLPSWPLVAGVLVVGVYVWFNPLVGAPARPLDEATLTLAAEGQAPDLETATTVFDLGPVACDDGASGTVSPDDTLASFGGRYSGYIQGIDSTTCLIFTAARDFEPLSGGELGLLWERLFEDRAEAFEHPSLDGRALIRFGSPSDGLTAIGNLDPGGLYAVVVLTDADDGDGGIEEVFRQIADLALRPEGVN
jgi:hypothetical protein